MEKSESNCINYDHSVSSAKNNTIDEEVLKDDFYSNNRHRFGEACFHFHDQDYTEHVKKFQFYLDTVSWIVKPGCSPEVLNVALTCMSTIMQRLSVMSSRTHPLASL